MNLPQPTRPFGDGERYVMRRGFPLAMNAVMPQLSDCQAERRGDLTFVRPHGKSVAAELLDVGCQVANIPIVGAERLREKPIGFLARHDLWLLPPPKQGIRLGLRQQTRVANAEA